MPRMKPTRLLALGGVVLLAFFYWKPTHSYFRTKHELEVRRLQVASLLVERAKLQKKIADAGSQRELVREARQLGWVKPGERLFIVRGISQWRKHH